MLSPGSLFAGYRIVRALGAGGMGEVYLAAHPRLPRQDALKLLPRDLSDVSSDPTYRARFIREADLASGLDHPSIVSVYDRGEEQGQLWIAMKYIPGSDANVLIKENGPFSPADAAEVITAVADALDYAHGKGLLHRDVKPANILIDGSQATRRKIYLTDFGIARTVGNDTALTAADLTVGSIQYTSPEQLRGGDLNGRADQYSLACTAFRLLTGSAPYPERKPTEIINAHLHHPIPRARALRPELAPTVDAVLARGMDKSAVNRYPTCMDFARDLRTALTSSSASSSSGGYQPTMINPGSIGVPAQPQQQSPQQSPYQQAPQNRPAQPGSAQPGSPQPGPQQPGSTRHYTPAPVPLAADRPYAPQPHTPQNPYSPQNSQYGRPQSGPAPYGQPFGAPPPGSGGGGDRASSGGGGGARTALIVVGVLTVAVLLAGLVFWLVSQSDDDSTTASPSSSSASVPSVESSSPASSSTSVADAAVVNGVPTRCVDGTGTTNRSVTQLVSGKIEIPPSAMPPSWTPDNGTTVYPFVTDADGVYKSVAGTWASQISVGTLPSDFRSDTDAIARKFLECLAAGPGYDSVRTSGPVGTEVRDDRIEDRETRVSILTSTIPVLGGPAGVTGDELMIIVVDSVPMTVAVGINLIGDSSTRTIVRKAVSGLLVSQ